MKIFHSLIVLITVLYIPSAWGQCSTGVDTGGQCIPPDQLYDQNGSQHAQPAPPPHVIWAARWGAIAEDAQASAVGTVVEQESKSKAEGEALALCAEHGGQHCTIALTYYNQCAAVAVNQKNMAVHARAPTKEQAERAALAGFDRGDTTKIVYSACSPPVRVQ